MATNNDRYAAEKAALDKAYASSASYPKLGESSFTNQAGFQNSSTSGSQTQNSTSTQSQQTSTLDSVSIQQLQSLIGQLLQGGTPEMIAERAAQERLRTELRQALLGYSKDEAFSDAEDLMALNLQQAMEKQMPAIQRAIEGAGTSASAMQALLSSNLARDSSLAAGSLGAQQAVSYGQIMASLMNTLSQASTPQAMQTKALLDAFNTLKGASTSSTTTGSQSSTTRSSQDTATITGQQGSAIGQNTLYNPSTNQVVNPSQGADNPWGVTQDMQRSSWYADAYDALRNSGSIYI